MPTATTLQSWALIPQRPASGWLGLIVVSPETASMRLTTNFQVLRPYPIRLPRLQPSRDPAGIRRLPAGICKLSASSARSVVQVACQRIVNLLHSKRRNRFDEVVRQKFFQAFCNCSNYICRFVIPPLQSLHQPLSHRSTIISGSPDRCCWRVTSW